MSPADAKRNANATPNHSCPCYCYCGCWCQDIDDSAWESFSEHYLTYSMDHGYAQWMK